MAQEIQIVPFGDSGDQFTFPTGYGDPYANAEFTPYLVPVAQAPPPVVIAPAPVMQYRGGGPTQPEMKERIRKTKRSNRDILIALIVFLLLLLLVVGLIVWLVLTQGGGVGAATTKPVIETTVEFTVTRTDMIYGTMLADANSFAFIQAQQTLCTMISTEWLSESMLCGSNAMSQASAGGVTAVMQVTFKNEGTSAEDVRVFAGDKVAAASEADTRTPTIASDDVKILSTSTDSTS